MSQSRHSTRCPIWASDSATLAVKVVLPVPPLPDATAMILPMDFLLSWAAYTSGAFLIRAKARGNCFGVCCVFSMDTMRCTTSVSGTV